MATQIFLGKPSASVEAWIKGHPPTPEPSPTPNPGKVLYKTSSSEQNWQEEDAQISNGAFNGFDSKTNAIEVIIPSKDANGNDVTSIGNHAFFDCSRLTSVTIPNGVENIHDSAFQGCTGLTGTLVIPDSVTEIGWQVFQGCSGLTNVTISNNVKTIGIQAFYGCSSLTSMTIPNSVTSIDEKVFYGCSNLTEMSMLGFTCDYVKENAYYWGIAVPAKQLVTIQCSDGYVILNDKSQSSDGSKQDPRKTRAVIYGKTYEKLIEGIAFGEEIFGNHILQQASSIEFGRAVVSIDNSAFYMCAGLKSVTIPDSVINIQDYAFEGTGLTNVTIPDAGIMCINRGAFQNCSRLTSVTVNGHPFFETNIWFNCNYLSEMQMLSFTCNEVKDNALNWGIAVPAKQLVTIQCSDGYVILNDKSQSSDGKTNA